MSTFEMGTHGEEVNCAVGKLGPSRQAHNLKIAGSNPACATTNMREWCNGSHAVLRSQWSKDRGGSSPLSRTKFVLKVL